MQANQRIEASKVQDCRSLGEQIVEEVKCDGKISNMYSRSLALLSSERLPELTYLIVIDDDKGGC